VRSSIELLATKDDIADLHRELLKKKGNIVKWMFIFWITQVGATFAIFYFFLRK